MVLKLKKEIYDCEKVSFAVLDEFKEIVAVVCAARKGFYVNNREGAQIGKITVYKNMAKAYAGEAETPTIVTFLQNGKFLVAGAAGEKEISVWGNPKACSYDIYFGSAVAASVATAVKEPEELSILVAKGVNVLKVLLLVLAVGNFAKPCKSTCEPALTAHPDYNKFDITEPENEGYDAYETPVYTKKTKKDKH
jgi:pheromone shutdown protein TraB